MERLTTPAATTSTGLPVYSGPLQELINKLAEYEDAEEAGLLVRLPYKLGTEMYYTSRGHQKVFDAVIVGYNLDRAALRIEFIYFLDFGAASHYKARYEYAAANLLFLSREEAERALKAEDRHE